MKIQHRITIITSPILAAALCLAPQIMSAAPQQNNQTAPQSDNNSSASMSQQPGANPDPSQQGNPQSTGTTVDSSKAPLQPVTTYPEAPAPQPDQPQNPSQAAPVTTTTGQPAPQTQKPESQPVGAAAAERVPAAGGAAAKPVGEAIAPAKQHQARAWLVKIGAIAAGGVAAGTIYALSHGTSSKPPGTGLPGVTQK